MEDKIIEILKEYRESMMDYVHGQDQYPSLESFATRIEALYELPTEEEIRQLILLNMTYSHGATKAAKAITNLLKGEGNGNNNG